MITSADASPKVLLNGVSQRDSGKKWQFLYDHEQHVITYSLHGIDKCLCGVNIWSYIKTNTSVGHKCACNVWKLIYTYNS